MNYIIDTNIVSKILRKDKNVINRLKEVLQTNHTVILSPVVFYEIKRGLMDRDAHKQMSFFEKLSKDLMWDDINKSIWSYAAELWAKCKKSGKKQEDADLLIAAHVQNKRAILVTDNIKHFTELNIPVENWT